MAKGMSLLRDPRYLAFVERYAFDALRFAVEVVGLEPTWQQIELLNAVSKPGCRVSVSSGHGTGKTAAFGVIGLWHLLVYRNSNCICTGPRLKTVNDGIWKEFTAHKASIENGPHAWIADYFTIESQKVYVVGHKMDWWVTAKTAPVGRPDNIAGAHNAWLLWICDESSGIPDPNFGVIGGSLTDARNRLVCASQPLRPSGYFYDTHHRLSTANGGVFTSLVFNSEESPIVSTNFLREKRMEYGGSDAPEYQIKVKGQFPENSDKYLLGRGMIERLIDADPVIKPGEFFGNLLIVDVGAGVYRDKTVATHVRVIGNGDRVDPEPRRVEVVSIPIYTNALDWTPVAKLATEYAAGLSNCTVIVDTHGMGVQFAKRMEEFGCPNVIKSNWGAKPFKKRWKERFFNLRAQCSVLAAEAVKDGRITFIGDYRKDLLDQGSRIPFHIDEKGLWHIAKKEDMAADGIPSPDLWDTICMAFLETATYIQADDSFAGGEALDREERAALLAELETA